MNETEFNIRMESIDNILAKINMPIYKRPLNAIHEYSIKYKTSIIIAGNTLFKSEDKYNELNLALAINEWYDNRYGDKVIVDLSKGKIAILLKGNVYKLIVPLIFGSAIVDFRNKKDSKNTSEKNGTMLLNVANFIEGLTDELLSKISDTEGFEFVKIYGIAAELFNLLDNDSFKNDLCESAKTDFDIAVESLCNKDIAIGHSKWATLQAVEKITKSVLNYYKIPFAKTHKLEKLFKNLKGICFSKINDDLINTIQCEPSIRYEKGNYTLNDAIKAHHYSLYLSKELLKCCV